MRHSKQFSSLIGLNFAGSFTWMQLEISRRLIQVFQIEEGRQMVALPTYTCIQFCVHESSNVWILCTGITM